MANKRISIHEFMEQSFCDATSDHLYTLREKLFEAGHISSIEQKYVYSDEAKDMCLEWFLDDLARQDELGSTGSWGKQFEVEARIEYSKARNTPFRISDTKCRPAGVRDMTIRVEGGNYSVELKTGAGAVSYGTDKADAHEQKKAFFRKNPIICWDFECTGKPLCMKAHDLLEVLNGYKNGVSMWFVDMPNVDKTGKKLNRSYQVNFSVQEGPKMEYLRMVRDTMNVGYDWHRLVKYADFGKEEE